MKSLSVYADKIDWMFVPGLAGQNIGAIGFINNRIAVISAFFEEGKKDGTLFWFDWSLEKNWPICCESHAVLEVAFSASVMPEVIRRDGSFYKWSQHYFTNFAGKINTEATLVSFFSIEIKKLNEEASAIIGGGLVREYIIRPGMEAAVHRCYASSVRERIRTLR